MGSGQVLTFQFHAQSANTGTRCWKDSSSQNPQPSLHGTEAVWQKLLHVGSSCLGEVGHCAKSATGCAVIQKSTDARCRILCQHDIICAKGFLFGFKRWENSGKKGHQSYQAKLWWIHLRTSFSLPILWLYKQKGLRVMKDGYEFLHMAFVTRL